MQAVSATVAAQGADGLLVQDTHTDGAGRYRLSLPPGQYTLTVDTGGRFPMCPQTRVTVAAGTMRIADVTCVTPYP